MLYLSKYTFWDSFIQLPNSDDFPMGSLEFPFERVCFPLNSVHATVPLIMDVGILTFIYSCFRKGVFV